MTDARKDYGRRKHNTRTSVRLERMQSERIRELGAALTVPAEIYRCTRTHHVGSDIVHTYKYEGRSSTASSTYHLLVVYVAVLVVRFDMRTTINAARAFPVHSSRLTALRPRPPTLPSALERAATAAASAT